MLIELYNSYNMYNHLLFNFCYFTCKLITCWIRVTCDILHFVLLDGTNNVINKNMINVLISCLWLATACPQEFIIRLLEYENSLSKVSSTILFPPKLKIQKFDSFAKSTPRRIILLSSIPYCHNTISYVQLSKIHKFTLHVSVSIMLEENLGIWWTQIMAWNDKNDSHHGSCVQHLGTMWLKGWVEIGIFPN